MATSLDDKFQSITSEYDTEINQTIELLKEIAEKKIENPLHPIDSKKTNERKSFSEKTFGYHESLLSVLFSKSDSVKSIYNIAAAIMSTLFIYLMLFEYKKTQTLFDIETWQWIFNKLDYVFNIWIRIFLYQFLILPMVQIIHKTKPKKIIWITGYVMFQLMMCCYIHKACSDNLLNFGSCMILTCECARMSMKTHSYLRTI